MNKPKLVHIFYNSAGNGGLYIKPIYDALCNDYVQKCYVNYYYPKAYENFERTFFKFTERNENNPYIRLFFLDILRKIARYIELKLENAKMIRSMVKFEPDIVNYSLMNMPDSMEFIKRIKKSLPKATILVTCHDVTPFESTKGINYQCIYNLSDFLLTHTQNAIEILQNEYSVDKNKIIYHPFPLINLLEINNIKNKIIPNKSPIFLFIGAIREEKGVQHLVDAWELLGEDFNAELVIAGFRPSNVFIDFTKIEKHKNVNLKIAYLSDEDYINLVSQADYVVFPYTKVGNSGVLSTAVSLSKVPIVSRLPTFTESLYYQEHLCFEPGNVKDLVNCLRRTRDTFTESYGEEQRKIAESFDKDKMIFFEEVCRAYAMVKAPSYDVSP
ncbi:MAG: glycosyltransferase [Defluviitaleaceae bacterium]|nr:glycosyltransferase [Defluviitaleaceae bacterium]